MRRLITPEVLLAMKLLATTDEPYALHLLGLFAQGRLPRGFEKTVGGTQQAILRVGAIGPTIAVGVAGGCHDK